MKNDIILYEKIYKNLKYKIECGLLPEGYRLPSRANMCKEFETSEKPVRCAIDMLVKDGLVETKPRQRPVVASCKNMAHRTAERALKKAVATAANDALKTGVLLCYPIIERGISLCRGEDWVIPQTIVEHMNPEETTRFWHLSNSFWRFFVARNNNEFILRTVDSMGYSQMDSLIGSYEVRCGYLTTLKEFLRTIKRGGDPASIHFEDMSFVYGFSSEKEEDTPAYKVPQNSVFLLGAEELEQKLCRGEERYSRVYLDIIGMIEMGCYKKGEYLPSHIELQKIYGVSIDTTLKAIKILKEWGVVNAAPRRGIWVTMDLEDLKRIHINPKLIACHVRRFLDSLELLTLTIEGVTAHAAEHIGKDEVGHLSKDLEGRWNDSLMYHFFPSVLLKFITGHIRYEMLRSIYEVLCRNFRIGRSIPKLIGRKKTGQDYENYKKCMAAVEFLINGDFRCFAEQTAELFRDIRFQIIKACKEIGYWEDAMLVYDGTTLWK